MHTQLLSVLVSSVAITTAFPLGLKLRNGVKVPEVALGTGYHGSLPPSEAVKHAHKATAMWLKAGGSHIDTAWWYHDQVCQQNLVVVYDVVLRSSFTLLTLCVNTFAFG